MGQIVENKDIDVHHRKENMFLCSNKNINQSEGKANAMFVQDMSFMYQFPCTMSSIKGANEQLFVVLSSIMPMANKLASSKNRKLKS